MQSLLFDRGAGWTASSAKAWAKSHGYKHGKVHVTDQYIRIRQFDPKGLKVKRTIPFGRGIRAVVAREEDMKRRRAKKSAAPRRRRRAHPAATKPTSRRRRRVREAAPSRTRRRAMPGSTMMEAKKKKTRRRRRVREEAWKGDSAGHSRAAKKGHRRRKARKAGRRRKSRAREYTYEARRPRRRSRRRRAREMSEAPRRRGRRRSRKMHETRSRRRYMRASRGGGGMGVGDFAIAIGTAAVGFIAADALDRFLATYNPSKAPAPKDKFTSDGNGTLANTLNVADSPNLYRAGAVIGATAVPAVASMFVKNEYARTALQGFAIGAGVKAFSLLWSNLLMPMLKPKDTSPASMQKSVIARLYPSEVAASINRSLAPTIGTNASGVVFGGLSQAPQQQQAGVGAPADVGPFALSGDSAYPDAAQALRQGAGVHEQFPSVQNTWGTGERFPTAAQAMGTGAPAAAPVPTQVVVPAPQAYSPGPPAPPGPGPQARPHKDEGCGCIGEDNAFLGFIGDEEKDVLLPLGTKAA